MPSRSSSSICARHMGHSASSLISIGNPSAARRLTRSNVGSKPGLPYGKTGLKSRSKPEATPQPNSPYTEYASIHIYRASRLRPAGAAVRNRSSRRLLSAVGRYTCGPQHREIAPRSAASHVVESAGSPRAGMGRYASGPPPILPSSEPAIWRESVRDLGSNCFACSGGPRVGSGSPRLRSPLEHLSRSVRTLYPACLAGH